MAFAGLKKQFNKCNQYVTEKIGGVEGTKLDIDFMEMERKTDVTNELVDELQMKTKEFLQPNPTARAKMAAVKGISKLSGQAKSNTYPQPEGIIGECMITYGRKLGDDSVFGTSLSEMGDSLKEMADVKYALDDNIKQNFLEPLHHLQTKDLKEVMHHRKKLQGRRLDFDCKKRRQAKGSSVSDEEVKLAEDKFVESLKLASVGMINLLDNEVEQVSQLTTFAESLLDYHQQCTEILTLLVETMKEKKEEARRRPKINYAPKAIDELISMEEGGGPSSSSSQSGLAWDNNNKATNPSQQASNNSPTKQQVPVTGTFSSSSSSTTPTGNYSNMTSSSTTTTTTNQTLSQQQQVFRAAPNLPPGASSSSSSAAHNLKKQPHCTAIYDFEPENPGELGFKENDVIQLISRIDDNWFEGSLKGRTGYFPISYVDVNIPLP